MSSVRRFTFNVMEWLVLQNVCSCIMLMVNKYNDIITAIVKVSCGCNASQKGVIACYNMVSGVNLEMVLDINMIKNLVRDNKIQWRGHMLARMQPRGIILNDVLKCILNGDIIESYPTDYPYPSCLVLGFIDNGRALHVVCAIGEDRIWMITSYYPGKEEWTDNFRKRKG